MRPKYSTVIIIAALVSALFLVTTLDSAYAQQTRGCCCDQATPQTSSTLPDATFCNQNHYFYPLSAQELFNQSFTCDVKCAQTVNQTPNAICGDGTCDTANGENNANCPLDCSANLPSQGCAPGFTPPPQNVQVNPVKGQQAFRLDFALQCPADSVTIERCEGAGCTSFSAVETIAPTNTYTDRSTALKFRTNYTYRVTATYLQQNTGQASTTVTSNLGDIECLGQTGFDQFCLGSFYYKQYESYLQQYGYLNAVTLSTWTNSFGTAVDLTFTPRFNQAWQCDARNRLFQGANPTVCSAQEVCVVDSTGPTCVTPGICELGNNPFGLFYTKDNCEGSNTTNRKYCFYDRSAANVNSCFECKQDMSCYDYKTEGACQRNNCGAGSCEWRDIFPDLGIGTCVDTRFNNCPNCNVAGTTSATNINSFNQFFDQCSDEKASALSTPAFPCFFNKNTQQGQSCDTISCADYSPSQCNANPSGITLDGANNVLTRSNDPCNIGVCEFSTATGCVKNADGTPTSQPGFADCVAGDLDCEKDYFAPQTSLVPTGASGRYDFLAIRISDKKTKTDNARDYTGSAGYETHLCVVTPNQPCNDASQFPITVSTDQLLVKNLALKDGQTILAPLVFGKNTIKYYSTDAANNPEKVKTLDVIACDNCSGPTVLKVEVSNGREVGANYYTSDPQPSITVTFDEPTTIQFAALSQGATSITLNSQNTPGSLAHTLLPTQPFSGTFIFGMDAVNSQNIGIDPALVFNLTHDDTAPTVSISPADKTSSTGTDMSITLQFSEKVTLTNASSNHVKFVTPFQVLYEPTNLNTASSQDQITYTQRLTGLANGLHRILIDAQDFAGNQVIAQSDYYIRTAQTDLIMRQPRFGIFSTTPFEVEVETTNNAECRYVFDGQAPSSTGFDFYDRFDQTQGTTHKITSFDKIQQGDTSTHTLHVYCKDQFGISQRSFNMHADLIAPQLLRAHAFPNPIAESDHPTNPVYTTQLSVEMNEEGFCRYSTTTQDFAQMQNNFPGFGLIPKKSHSITLTHTTINTFTYFVACQDVGGLTTGATTVTIGVDLNAPLELLSTTQTTSGTSQFTLAAATNKRALCYYGTQNNSISSCFGTCDLSRTHKHPTIANTTAGTVTYYLQCNNPVSQEQTGVTRVDIFIDTSPPIMTYVKDDSLNQADPQVSWFNDRIYVAFLAEDPESNISKYDYRIETAFTGQIIRDWTPSTQLDGNGFYATGLTLQEGARYIVKARPTNGVGLVGLEAESDGVVVDTTVRPAFCQDTIKSGNETDVDCGGLCGATCQVGQACNTNLDCALGLCTNGICTQPACDDTILTAGFESDIDCGLQCGATCANGNTCTADTDCASNYCLGGLCEVAPPCRDGQLTQATGETDIDCGGSCPTQCLEGQNCQVDTDCSSGLSCSLGQTCQLLSDIDNDGIPDERDQCPGSTSRGVDSNGCGDDQKFTCGDQIHDAWRKQFFGTILCSGDGAIDADPDGDGLTNLEEFNPSVGTNPTAYDTDGDGFGDGREVRAGKDPRSEISKPVSYLVIALVTILILAMLGGLGYAGYYGYQKYQERVRIATLERQREEAKRAAEEARLAKDAAARRKAEERKRQLDEKLKGLRNLSRGSQPGPNDYVDISKVKGKKQTSPTKHNSKDLGNKLKNIKKQLKK